MLPVAGCRAGLGDIMGYILQAGCFLVAFSPLLALSGCIVLRKGHLVILSIGAAFFWMLAALLSSFAWWVVPPLRSVWLSSVIEGVALQQCSRLLFFALYAKVSVTPYMHYKGRTILSTFEEETAIGVGFGFAHALIMYGSILWEADGVGSFYNPSCHLLPVYASSAFFTLFLSVMDVAWTYIGFEGFRTKSYPKVFFVVLCHLCAGCLSILNSSDIAGMCVFALLGFSALAILSSAVAAWTLRQRYFR